MPSHDVHLPESSINARQSRRGLLVRSATGLTVLAGGLIVSGLVSESQATKKAKRRRKRRRRNNNAPGSALNNITFHLQNINTSAFNVQFWDGKDEVSDHSWHNVKAV